MTARRGTRSLSASLIVLFVGLVTAPVGAQSADLAREIEILKECIDRTDPTQGQDAAWRETNCPDDPDTAKAELARLLEEQKERVEKTADAAATQVDTAEASLEERDAAEVTSRAGALKRRDRALRGAGAASAAPALTFPVLDQTLQTPAVPPVPRDPCSAGSGLAGASVPAGADLGFGAPAPVNTDLITLGLRSVEALCGDLTGRLAGLPALPASQALLLQVPTTLEVDKQANDSSFTTINQVGAGQSFFYDVFVTNNSGADADGTLTDDLPDEFDLSFVIDGQFTDCNDSDPISCTITDLPDGTADLVSFVMDVPEDWCDTADPVTPVSNTANTFQGETLAGTDTVLVEIICPQLDVEKFVPGGNELESGETFAYQIELTNNTEDPADASITDELPEEFEPGDLIELGGFDCTLTGHTLDCTIEGLGSGDTATVIMFMTVPEDFCSGKSGVSNTVEASQIIEGVEFFADRDKYIVDVLCSDVAIDKEAEREDYFTGELVEFEIQVINFGPGVAQNVIVDDQLPTGLQFVGVQVTDGPGSCAHQGGGLVHCELGDIDVEDERSLVITARVTNQAECSDEGTKLKNTAEVAADNEKESVICEFDCEELIRGESANSLAQSLIGGDNNSDTAKIFIHCAPDLVITKTAELSPDGREVTYTIRARNVGTADEEEVVVNDDLDNDLNNVSASTTGDGPCAVFAGNTVSCNVGTIPAGATETVTITADVPVGECPSPNRAEGAGINETRDARHNNEDSASVTGECVLGGGQERSLGSMAVTGMGFVPLFLLAAILVAGGLASRRAAGEGRRRGR